MEKKNNNGLIIVLVGLVIVLAVLCVLFATKKITLNKETTNKQESNSEIIVNNNEKEDVYSIAKKLGDKLYKNLYSFNTAWVFCGENMKWGNEEDVNREPIKTLLSYYTKFHEEAEKDPALDDEARNTFVKLEKGEKEIWKDDIDAFISAANNMSVKLGKKPQFSTFKEFDAFMGTETALKL